MNVTGGDTNISTYFDIKLLNGQDATGLTETDFDLTYTRSGAAPAAKVDATAGTAGGAGAHSDNTIIEPDPTDAPGLWRVDWPDAAFAAGVKEVILTVKHTSCITAHLRVLIDAEVNVTKISDDATAADNLELDYDGTGYNKSNSTIGTCTTNTDMVAEAPTAAANADAVWDEAQSAHVGAGSFGVIATEIADILTDTAEIGAAGAGLTEAGGTGDHLTAVPWNAAWDAEVQSEVNDGLVAYDAATGTDVAAVETDTQNIQTRLPAALVGGRIDADVGAISTSTEAADKLELSTESILSGTASGTPTTTTMVSDIVVTDDDQFNGRIIIFSTATDAGLVRQATDITGCTAATNTLTFTALTVAPTSGDTFIIV